MFPGGSKQIRNGGPKTVLYVQTINPLEHNRMTTRKETTIIHATLLASIATVIMSAGCAQPAIDPASPCAADKTFDPHDKDARKVMLDDHGRMRDLIAEATKLINNKKATPIETLIKQLKRGKCSLKLPARSKRKLTRPELYRRNVAGVLIVSGLYKCGKCTKWHSSAASGFALTASGAIVTNHHVFESKTKKKTIIAMTHSGKVYPVKEVLAASKASDAAILQLDVGSDKLTPLPLAADTPVGSDVTVISHPRHRFYTLTEGVISRYSKNRTKRGMMDTVAITADFARGSSGGPIFDQFGNATAMVASTSSVYYTQTKDTQKNLQMVFKQCVPAASILKLIDNQAGK